MRRSGGGGEENALKRRRQEEAAAASVRARAAAQSGPPLGRPQARRAGQGRFFANTWRQVHWVREGGEKHIEDAEGSHVVT